MTEAALAIRDEGHYLEVVREVRALAERCDTVNEAKDLADRAAAAKVYAERAKLGGDMVNRAAAARLWAERRAGELLSDTPKNKGAAGIGTSAVPKTNRTPTLADIGLTKRESSRYQALADIPAEDFEQAIEQVAEAGPVTAEAVKRTALGTLKSSDSNEWYTPARYVDLVRDFMGGIDLDPASSEAANVTVRAERFFTEVDDGLRQEWRGRVWLNPPYGSVCAAFVRKLEEEYDSGRTVEAVLLVSAYSTETRWFQPLFARPICFVDHRIRFVSGDGRPAASSTIGNAFVYFGAREGAFTAKFSELGAVVQERSTLGLRKAA